MSAQIINQIINYSYTDSNELLIGLSPGDKVHFKSNGIIKKNDNQFEIKNVATTITKVTNSKNEQYQLTDSLNKNVSQDGILLR